LTTARIDACFARLRDENRAAFIPYIMAGDPDLEATVALMRGLPASGADLIELGFPFSDPMAEGVPIQKAAQRALKGGTTVRSTFEAVRRFREVDQATPVILMGYHNIVLSLGFAAFADAAAAAGVDGLIVVDCPPEEADPLVDALDAHALSLIRLATPTSDDERLKVIARRTSGFLYYVSVAGVTGAKEADAGAVAPAVSRVRLAAGLPVAVGFGVRTPERAGAIARVADAVVVGSALVDIGAAAAAAGADPVERVLAQARILAQAVHGARTAR